MRAHSPRSGHKLDPVGLLKSLPTALKRDRLQSLLCVRVRPSQRTDPEYARRAMETKPRSRQIKGRNNEQLEGITIAATLVAERVQFAELMKRRAASIALMVISLLLGK